MPNQSNVDKLVYGGYLYFPLAPKDIKGIVALTEKCITPDDLLEMLRDMVQSGFGLKIEQSSDGERWKCVTYNLTPVEEGDNHSYFLSGESDSLVGALCTIRYKLSEVSKYGYAQFLSEKSKPKFT